MGFLGEGGPELENLSWKFGKMLVTCIFPLSQNGFRGCLFNVMNTGPVFTNHSQEHSLSLSPRFANLNVTQLLIG